MTSDRPDAAPETSAITTGDSQAKGTEPEGDQTFKSQTPHSEQLPLTPVGVPTDFRINGVRGWLLFFVVTLVLFSPLQLCGMMAETSREFGKLYDVYPTLKIVNVITQVYGVALVCFSIFAGGGLLKRWDKAVRNAKAYLVVRAIATTQLLFLPLFAGLPEHINNAVWASLPLDVLKTLVYPTVWYLYLTKSKRVATTYFDFCESRS